MREPALPDVTAKRRYVADLEIGESVDTVFLLSEHHPGKTKNDDWYLRTKFSDKSGTIAGIMWSDSGAEEAAKNTKEGDHVRVVGVVDDGLGGGLGAEGGAESAGVCEVGEG